MSFINVGARTLNGVDVKTKAELTRLVADNPANVVVYTTAMFGRQFADKLSELDDVLSAGNKLSVVGPNPYNNRKWYATIEKNAAGKVVVKK